MKFEDILPFIREGKKVRRTDWLQQDYMMLITNQYGDKEFIFRFFPFTEVINRGLAAHEVLAEDWEVYGNET